MNAQIDCRAINAGMPCVVVVASVCLVCLLVALQPSCCAEPPLIISGDLPISLDSYLEQIDRVAAQLEDALLAPDISLGWRNPDNDLAVTSTTLVISTRQVVENFDRVTFPAHVEPISRQLLIACMQLAFAAGKLREAVETQNPDHLVEAYESYQDFLTSYNAFKPWNVKIEPARKPKYTDPDDPRSRPDFNTRLNLITHEDLFKILKIDGKIPDSTVLDSAVHYYTGQKHDSTVLYFRGGTRYVTKSKIR